jgi:hypothetical protein
MLSVQEILDTIDNANKGGYYCHFVWLADAYSYLIDCRLNVFRNNNHKWVVAIERLGYNPRAGSILLQIFYYGNCLRNLEEYNGQFTNYYAIEPIDWDSFNEAIKGEYLRQDARFWLVRGEKVTLSLEIDDYLKAGIEPTGYRPEEISVQMAARLAVSQYRNLFRATDQELYKSIPADLEKILVLDEWYHKDFNELIQPKISDEQIKMSFELQKKLKGELKPNLDEFTELLRNQESKNAEWNNSQWEDNRPSSYETWQQLAKVIARGDINYYRPTLAPNTHWKHYPESGSL